MKTQKKYLPYLILGGLVSVYIYANLASTPETAKKISDYEYCITSCKDEGNTVEMCTSKSYCGEITDKPKKVSTNPTVAK